MGSYDNIVKTEEIRKKVEEGDFLSAQKILDTMQLKKLNNISDLGLLAEVYKENERYEEATALYLKIYARTKTRKTISQLVDINIKRGNAEDAEEYLAQYRKVSSEDFDSYVLRYKLEKLKGVTYDQLIDILLTLKKTEYSEKWAYELAKVYYKAGMEEECRKECSDIILWFSEGAYVEKAKMLYSYYSGETGKEKIMEELRRRAEQSEEDTLTQDSPLKNEFTDSYVEINPGSDFMSEEEEELEFGLKKDIKDMMIEPNQQDYEDFDESTDQDDNSYRNESTDQDGIVDLDYEQTNMDASEEISSIQGDDYIDEIETDTEEQSQTGDYSNDVYEAGEYESEQPVEVIPDEEDIKLKQIAEKKMIVPDEIFGNFLHIVTIKKQIVKSLEVISQDSKKSVLMIITGAKGSGKTALAKDMALFLSKTGRIKSTKVAKISAEKLNTVDLEAKRETLRSSCMVVENASELKRETIENLLELTKRLQGDIAVIFEEEKKNMNRLFRECPRLMDLLKIRIHLPQYSIEDLMGFAIAYLKQKDYLIGQKAEAVLMNRLKQIVKQSNPHTYLDQINDLCQSVMNAADLRTGRQLTSLAAQGRLEDVGILFILPEDFKN
jgi:hypothetical protein